jgi:pyrroline-5-carboxylate reductase
MATGAGWLGAATGDQDAAALYTTQLIRGFLDALPPASADQLARERDALATQGTISLQMTTALRDGRCHDTLEHALDAINTRLKAKS